MKSSIFWLILAPAILLTMACEKESFDDRPPVILINGDTELSDTIKFSADPFYAFDFSIIDDRPWRELSVSNLRDGLLRFRGKIINDLPVEVTDVEFGRLEFQALQPGYFSFTLEVRDENDRKASADISLLVFENLAPVAALTLEQTDEVSLYQVKIDATQSYDPDSRWGGKIMQWEFTIKDFYTTMVDRPVIQYIFPEPGTYTISVRVRDNDGAWSESIIRNITVQ